MRNPPNRPYFRKSHPLGTEDTAAPIKKVPTVNAANDFDAPRYVADRGPTVVSSVDVESVNAHAMASKDMFQNGEEVTLNLSAGDNMIKSQKNKNE